ncbi:hypothetical protein [Demequina pelophila]|uniref:hypothetical protein n=1 Tax=Demequina pelophila TaxID=1638984 RepID=UPI000780BBC9|nr:hypothetical protein [Demequina pelophila]
MSPERLRPALGETIPRRVASFLTPREMELLGGYLAGEDEAELAERLGYPSEGSVRVKLNRIRWYVAAALPKDDAARADLTARRGVSAPQ